jgi:hypothetical protein
LPCCDENTHMVIFMYVFFGLLAAVPIAFTLLIIVTAMIEKRLIWPYSEPHRPDVMDDKNYSSKNRQYVDNALVHMEHNNFRLLNLYHDIKGPKYQASYLFALSEDGLTLAVLGYGEIFSLPVKGVGLISKNREGRHYYTSNSGVVEPCDVSGMSEVCFCVDMDFTDIYRQHQQWMERVSAVPFSSDNALSEYRTFLTDRTQVRQERGLVCYLDDEKQWWKYTFLGTMKYVWLGNIKPLFLAGGSKVYKT